jgi:N,N'-diacetyllegionaminate synthase
VYVRAVRDAEAMLGSDKKVIAESARQYMPLVFKSVVVRGGIKKGEIFTKTNLTIKRPGTGLPPKLYPEVLGTKAMRDLRHDDIIKRTDYAKK